MLRLTSWAMPTRLNDSISITKNCGALMDSAAID